MKTAPTPQQRDGDFFELEQAVAQSNALGRLLLDVVKDHSKEDEELRAHFEFGLSELVYSSAERLSEAYRKVSLH